MADSPSINKKRGFAIVLSSPSGAGKSTLARAMLDNDKSLSLSISLTTRPKRQSEQDGREYYFTDSKTFKQRRDEGLLLEWAEIFGHLYGTPKQKVEEVLNQGKDLLFDIDWQGCQQLKQNMPNDLISIFILPPSRAILEQRLRTRAQDSDAQIALRLQTAAKEMSHWPEYDFIVINDDKEKALAQIQAIVTAEHLRRERQLDMHEFITSLSKHA